MKIGVYGGTFNPPHLGHLAAARAAIEALELDKLLLIPAAVPPHKDLPQETPSLEHRLAMVEKMADGLQMPKVVEVSRLELERDGKSYTSDTLKEIHAQYPGAQLWLLMGTDMFLTLHQWHDPEEILKLAGICAFGRREQDGEVIFAPQRAFLEEQYGANVVTMTLPDLVDISSTQLRDLLARGEGAKYLHPSIYGYILMNGLYGTHADLKHLDIPELRACSYSMVKEKRVRHIRGTEEEAVRLAKRWGADETMARRAGITKVNLDLMYGLASQSAATIEADLAAVRRLSPEQVTLYELRPNRISAMCPFSKDELYHHYTLFFDGLSALGYKARFGQNTFTKDAADEGVSSYLRSRMLEGASYKGFGLSAQSMSRRGVSYNVGKVARPDSALLARSTFGEQDTYLLPPEELAAKYIAISAYHGSFSLEHLSRMLGRNAVRHYEAPTAFCLQNGLMEASGDRLCITREGFRHYGAVFSLFYAPS